MSTAFFWFLLIVSVVLLGIGVTHLETAKPAVLVLWLVVGGFAAYRLFAKRS